MLLSSFESNGHTLGFHPQTERLELLCTDCRRVQCIWIAIPRGSAAEI